MHTSATIRLSSNRVQLRLLMARWMSSERSYTGWIETPSGKPPEISEILAFRLWMTSCAFWP